MVLDPSFQNLYFIKMRYAWGVYLKMTNSDVGVRVCRIMIKRDGGVGNAKKYPIVNFGQTYNKLTNYAPKLYSQS